MNWSKKRSGRSELESRGNVIAYVIESAALPKHGVTRGWWGFVDNGPSMIGLGPFEKEDVARKAVRTALNGLVSTITE
jgi:hypothetical protein